MPFQNKHTFVQNRKETDKHAEEKKLANWLHTKQASHKQQI